MDLWSDQIRLFLCSHVLKRIKLLFLSFHASTEIHPNHTFNFVPGVSFRINLITTLFPWLVLFNVELLLCYTSGFVREVRKLFLELDFYIWCLSLLLIKSLEAFWVLLPEKIRVCSNNTPEFRDGSELKFSPRQYEFRDISKGWDTIKFSF